MCFQHVWLQQTWSPPALPAAGFGALAYQVGRIPGAGFFDLASIADTTTSPGLPLMLPTPAAFGAAADALGISPQDTVVVYDGRGPFGQFTAARAWWMWHVMGHSRCVHLREGGRVTGYCKAARRCSLLTTHAMPHAVPAVVGAYAWPHTACAS